VASLCRASNENTLYSTAQITYGAGEALASRTNLVRESINVTLSRRGKETLGVWGGCGGSGGITGAGVLRGGRSSIAWSFQSYRPTGGNWGES